MKKALNIIKKTLVWLVILLAISMMIFTVVSVTTFNRNDRSLFGYKMYIVNSDSMAATDFSAGALILVKEVDPSTLKEGDIISFLSQSTASFGETVTHKIRKVTVNAEGNPGFVTYGTTTGEDDETIVTYPYVLGRYEKSIPWLGRLFSFLKTTPGYFLCIFTPFMLIILYEGVKFFNLFHTADFDLTVSYQETDGTWVEVTEQTELFDKNAKYEPGYVQVVYLKVDNTGTRSFVFHTAVNVNGCVVAANDFGQQFMLQDYLKFGITVSDTPEAMKNSIPNRAAAVAIANQSLRNYATDTAELLPGDTKYVTLIVRMPEKVNNLANYRGDAVPTVELGITVKADQN